MTTRAWTPGALVELSGSYWQSCALHAAVKLDLVTRLDEAPRSVDELADLLQGSARGIGALLTALCAMGLAVKSGARYAASPDARRWLSKRSDAYLGHIILHHHHLVASWGRLDQAVVSGRPVRDRSAVSEAAWRESFLMGMFALAMATAPRLIPALDLADRRRLLDLGGGPGTYAIQFCRAHPQLTAAVFDLPASRAFAERTIDRFAMGERVAFIPGDYHTDEIPGRYDVAWLSHILHAEGPEACLALLRKAVSALEPGGLVIIHEFILDDAEEGPLFPALFSLNMLLGTEAGRAYSQRQLVEMLRAAGATRCERVPVQTPNDSGLVVGHV
jgi:SAM-dependent methyltransferase